jgi:hypothetical protein
LDWPLPVGSPEISQVPSPFLSCRGRDEVWGFWAKVLKVLETSRSNAVKTKIVFSFCIFISPFLLLDFAESYRNRQTTRSESLVRHMEALEFSELCRKFEKYYDQKHPPELECTDCTPVDTQMHLLQNQQCQRRSWRGIEDVSYGEEVMAPDGNDHQKAANPTPRFEIHSAD